VRDEDRVWLKVNACDGVARMLGAWVDVGDFDCVGVTVSVGVDVPLGERDVVCVEVCVLVGDALGSPIVDKSTRNV